MMRKGRQYAASTLLQWPRDKCGQPPAIYSSRGWQQALATITRVPHGTADFLKQVRVKAPQAALA